MKKILIFLLNSIAKNLQEKYIVAMFAVSKRFNETIVGIKCS
jgi:hypothetical protein